VTTGALGTAQVTFSTPGWHRLKAVLPEDGGVPQAITSNRLDVCVPAAGAGDCGPPPPDDEVRTLLKENEPQPPAEEHKQEQPSPAPGGGVSGDVFTAAAPLAKALRVGGLSLAPIDDRAAGLLYRGRWRHIRESGAWEGTLSVGSPGATLTAHLAAGRPVFVVRGVRRRARVVLIVGSRREVFTIRGSTTKGSRALVGPRRADAGVVELRVLKGTVGVDALAATS
jgi:hypothetical protein